MTPKVEDSVPPAVANKARVVGALDWLDSLPGLVAELAAEWRLTIEAYYDDATEALVAAVQLEDGTPAVLKLILPQAGEPARNEITVLRLAGGSGCAELLRADAERGALLLERLGPSMHELGLPSERRHELLAATAGRLWRPVSLTGLPSGAEKARRLSQSVVDRWGELGRPVSRRTLDHARACAASRAEAHSSERAVLVHGDLHEWNALVAEQGFKLVDPDGLEAEAEYDLGIVMREDSLELLEGDPGARARRLAQLTNLDARAIWEWGCIERLSTGLLGRAIGLEPVATEMLAAAERIAEERWEP